MDGFEFHPNPAEVAPVNPNSCRDVSLTILRWILLAGFVFAALFIAIGTARADDSGEDHAQRPMAQSGHPPEHMEIHERFYKDWNRLDMPNESSCCDNQDCFPTIMLKYNGAWVALKKEWMMRLEARYKSGETDVQFPDFNASDHNGPAWVTVPERLLEHNSLRTDLGVLRPREERPSPDGRSHACISGSTPLCAVVGNGI